MGRSGGEAVRRGQTHGGVWGGGVCGGKWGGIGGRAGAMGQWGGMGGRGVGGCRGMGGHGGKGGGVGWQKMGGGECGPGHQRAEQCSVRAGHCSPSPADRRAGGHRAGANRSVDKQCGQSPPEKWNRWAHPDASLSTFAEVSWPSPPPSHGAVLTNPNSVSVGTAPKEHQPPTANRQPPTANRQPPTIVQYCFGFVSCPRLAPRSREGPRDRSFQFAL